MTNNKISEIRDLLSDYDDLKHEMSQCIDCLAEFKSMGRYGITTPGGHEIEFTKPEPFMEDYIVAKLENQIQDTLEEMQKVERQLTGEAV